MLALHMNDIKNQIPKRNVIVLSFVCIRLIHATSLFKYNHLRCIHNVATGRGDTERITNKILLNHCVLIERFMNGHGSS